MSNIIVCICFANSYWKYPEFMYSLQILDHPQMCMQPGKDSPFSSLPSVTCSHDNCSPMTNGSKFILQSISSKNYIMISDVIETTLCSSSQKTCPLATRSGLFPDTGDHQRLPSQSPLSDSKPKIGTSSLIHIKILFERA